MVTHSARSSLTEHLLEMAVLKPKEDSSKELSSHRIDRDHEDLTKVTSIIQDTLNPFITDSGDDYLYCLTTGKAATDGVKMGLLKYREIGIKWCGEFKEDCFKDGTIFTKPIKRRKIRNFGSDTLKIRISTKDNKIQELQVTRALFGCLLHLAVTKGVDLTTVLAYPLTPVPLSLGHVDDSINKSDKSTLMKNLEDRIDTVGQVEVDVCIIDAGVLI